MKAITYGEFGGSEVLRLREVEEPHAGSGQVRLKVVLAAVNPVDASIRSGAMQEVFEVPLPVTPGAEAGGIVDEVGEGVTDFAVGDEVVGWTLTGAYAEYALATNLARKPAELPWEAAVALPTAVETSDRVFDILKPVEGETLLVHGAAGVAGSAGVQLAVGRGVTVVGTASTANHDYVRSLGAIPVGYGEGLADRVRAAAPQGIDAVYDAVGHDVLGVAVDLRGGTTDRIVTIADLRALELGITFSFGSRRPFGPQLTEYLRDAVRGTPRVRVDRTFPLADAAAAHDLSAGGHPRGKLLLRP